MKGDEQSRGQLTAFGLWWDNYLKNMSGSSWIVVGQLLTFELLEDCRVEIPSGKLVLSYCTFGILGLLA